MQETIRFLESIIVILGKVSIAVLTISIIMAFLNYRYLNSALKFFLGFCVVRLMVSLLVQILFWALKVYGDFWLPIFQKLDIHNFNFTSILWHINNFGLLGWYFSLILVKNKISIVVRNISIFLFIVSIINYFFIEGYKYQSVFNSTSSSIFCFLLPLIHLWFLYNDMESKVPLVKNTYFWISLGLIIPNLIGLFLHFTGKKIETTDKVLFVKLNMVHDLFQIVGFILIAVGFYYARYTKYLPQKTTTLLPPQ